MTLAEPYFQNGVLRIADSPKSEYTALGARRIPDGVELLLGNDTDRVILAGLPLVLRPFDPKLWELILAFKLWGKMVCQSGWFRRGTSSMQCGQGRLTALSLPEPWFLPSSCRPPRRTLPSPGLPGRGTCRF